MLKLGLKRHDQGVKMTYILIGLNTIGYAIESILSRNPIQINPYVMAIVGQYNYLVLEYGWWWQLITSMFMHVHIIHFTLNMFWLWILGIQYERMFGGESLLITYLVTGLLGNILTLFLSPIQTISLGASGAIFGIFGVIIIFQGMVGGNLLYSIFLGLIIFMINMGFHVNIWAHLGGFVGGVLIGYYYGKKFKGFVSRPKMVYSYPHA